MDCKEYFFSSRIETLRPFAQRVDNREIKEEPMFFNANLDFAYKNGGPITRSFIENLPKHLYYVPAVFDSRVHMLMPGWFPAIPGFHHDDVPRPPIPVGQHFATAGQPDYDSPRYRSSHILGLVNAETAPTQFAIGDIELPGLPDDAVIYKEWHRHIQRAVDTGELSSVSTPDRTLVHFDWQTFHQATRAISNGWRWFGRVSWDTERASTCTNEYRRNAQVYLEFPMEGW
jgi:hypothetical protein